MPNKYTTKPDFVIPSAILDEADWIIDSFIDTLGRNCKLIYPPKDSECPNCIFDTGTKRSSGIYKTSGPSPFANYTVCPVCGGEGRSVKSIEESIKLRVYWSPKEWIRIPIPASTSNAVAQVIGYITDLPKLKMAQSIILESNIDNYHTYKVQPMGEALPHGFQRRYFIQYMEILNG